jgi:hypothetical protein
VTMKIGKGNEHFDFIHISVQISRQNEKNLKSTNIRSIIIIQFGTGRACLYIFRFRI